MQITFLGTSSGVPTRSRNVSSMAARLPQRSELWLFDCGEGTQHQFLKSNLRLSQLRKIFITHMHGDHIYGLPGLLASLGLAGKSSGVDIYGPKQLDSYLQGVFASSSSRVGYPIRIHPVEDAATKQKILFNEDGFSVRCTKLVHRIPAYAYRVEQESKPGRFSLDLANSLKIPPGPVYSELQKGKVVTLEDGRVFDGKDFCGSQRPGISMVYCTDTIFSEAAVDLSRKADLLVHEATYSHSDAQLAYQRQHSTTTMAAQTALEACVNQLIMTHFSPRYAPGNRLSPSDLLNEAKSIFPNTLLAKDFLQLDIKPGCNSS